MGSVRVARNRPRLLLTSSTTPDTASGAASYLEPFSVTNSKRPGVGAAHGAHSSRAARPRPYLAPRHHAADDTAEENHGEQRIEQDPIATLSRSGVLLRGVLRVGFAEHLLELIAI